MTKLGFVARGRIARAKAEAKEQRRIDDAPKRAQVWSLKARDDAFTVAVTAKMNIKTAEEAVAKWTKYLADYKAVAGLKALPREINDIKGRIDVADEVLARHRHELADAEARLTVAEAALQVAINPVTVEAQKPKKASR